MQAYIRALICVALLFQSVAIAADDTPITVGVSIPLTGAGATFGEDIRNSLILADEKLGGGRFRFIYEDDRCDPKEAAHVAQKFVSIDRVKYVLGIPCSGTVFASAPIYERAKVLTISVLGGAPKISQAGDYIFRTRASDVGSAELLGEHISKSHKRIGLLVEQTDYALAMAEMLRERLKERDVEVVQEEFLTGTSDLKPALLRLKANRITGLAAFVQSDQSLANVTRQSSEIKLSLPLYSSLFPGNPNFLKIAGESAEGIIFATLPSLQENGSDEGKELDREFQKRFGALQSFPYGLECTFEAFRALRDAIVSGQEPRSYLYTTEFHGIGGDYRFDQNGDIVGPKFVLRTIRNGAVVPL